MINLPKQQILLKGGFIVFLSITLYLYFTKRKKMELKRATTKELHEIWQIVDAARNEMVRQGRKQWDEHYPQITDIEEDIRQEKGWIVIEDDCVMGYVVFTNEKEEAYSQLEGGKWIANMPYGVIHRMAVSLQHRKKGLGRFIFTALEEKAREMGLTSVRADTNFDNVEMLHLFEKLGYTRCGIVHYPTLNNENKERIAFEKIVAKQ